MNSITNPITLRLMRSTTRVMPNRDGATGALLQRSNVVPTGADAKRMLFYRFLYDTCRINDDDN